MKVLSDSVRKRNIKIIGMPGEEKERSREKETVNNNN